MKQHFTKHCTSADKRTVITERWKANEGSPASPQLTALREFPGHSREKRKSRRGDEFREIKANRIHRTENQGEER